MVLPPPKLWQEFEELTRDVARFRFNDPGAKNYGNQGSTQNGVDVYCQEYGGGDLIGIQCKRRGSFDAQGRAFPGGLKVSDLAPAILEAKSFSQPLKRFILATTDSRKTDIQDEELRLNALQKQSGGFAFEVLFWEDYLGELHRHGELLKWYYQHILELKGVYSPDHQILYLFHVAFSRPAFTTPFLNEESGPHLVDALRDTETALNTGQLVDREMKGHIRSAPGGLTLIAEPAWQKAAEDALRLVREARSKYKVFKDAGDLIEVSTGVKALNPSVACELDRLRGDAIRSLNAALKSAELPEVISPL
jgi:hypothetical protein